MASGPSAKKARPELLEGRARVIAIKQSWELAKFADVVYGCDAPWWQHVQGLQKFGGLKLCYDKAVVGQWGIQPVEIKDNKSDRLLFDEIGSVGAGGCSGFQALNLALQFGARRIILVGIDAFGTYSREHWYGRNTAWRMNNPDENNYKRWRQAFAIAAEQIKEMGAQVANASTESSVICFSKMSIEEALTSWEMEAAA